MWNKDYSVAFRAARTKSKLNRYYNRFCQLFIDKYLCRICKKSSDEKYYD
jgi:hypothetical protein